ncbi:PAC2 family protein [Chloroflexota bacterium]
MTEGDLQKPSLIVIWAHEVGSLSKGLVTHLEEKLGWVCIEEIEPAGFFSLSGVDVKNDLIQFPTSKLYSSLKENVFFFVSHAPSREPYQFLSQVLDLAIECCGIKELYTTGGVVTSVTHTSPRRVFGIVNHGELNDVLTRCGVETGMDYQTPPGGGTSLSNYLLWISKTRNLAGCTLWVEVPFYLAGVRDPMASKSMLEVLDLRFSIGLDIHPINRVIDILNADIQNLRAQNTDIDRYIELLERGIALSEDEGDVLSREVIKLLYKYD